VTSIEVLMMSLLAMSLGLKFCTSRKDGTVESGWVLPKGINSMASFGCYFADLYGKRIIWNCFCQCWWLVSLLEWYVSSSGAKLYMGDDNW